MWVVEERDGTAAGTGTNLSLTFGLIKGSKRMLLPRRRTRKVAFPKSCLSTSIMLIVAVLSSAVVLLTCVADAFVPSYRPQQRSLHVLFDSEEYKRTLGTSSQENRTDTATVPENQNLAVSENAVQVVTVSTAATEESKKKNGYDMMNGHGAPTAPEVKSWTNIMSNGFLCDNANEIQDVEAMYKQLKDMSDYDRQQVDRYWDRLMPTVSYLGTMQVAKIYNALRVAYRAHRGQMRKSGEPFIIHPVEVALLLSGLKMDGETVMAGLLHDTVEDTDLTFAEVEAMFGKVVRSLVEGETKVSKLPKLAFSDYADEQAENLRQMFVAMTDDYRIIIVKLADRLHNMRTLRHMKPEKQIKISRETLDIFAPLAHRMGIWQFKSELEDTAFMYLYPLEYKRLNKRLRQHQTKFRNTLERSQEILERTLNADRVIREDSSGVRVYGRTKEVYSLWHKMETKGEHNLDNIVDVVALRVIITPQQKQEEDSKEVNEADRGVWLCYHVLGLVQHLPGFQPMPTKVKDYISFPKPNGYQSLHTALMLNGQAIEVQIRTLAMHHVAEYGMASHWAYTDGKRRKMDSFYNTPWLSSIKEWQDDSINSRDFVDSVRRELLGKRVFVFLRNGKILNLARGATAIDAAFQIHTEVGLAMEGVEINGKPVPLSYELHNGDVVSILTGDKGKPATDWMRYAKSRSTRSKLRSYFRQKQKESLCEAGKILLMDFLCMHGPLIEQSSYMPTGLKVPTTIEGVADFLPGRTRFVDIDDLLINIGKKHDRLFLHTVVSKLFLVPQPILTDAEKNKMARVPNSVVIAVYESRKVAKDAAQAVASSHATEPSIPLSNKANGDAVKEAMDESFADSTEDVEYADPEQLCDDCLPVLGDDIIGTKPPDGDDVLTTVHRIGCPHAQHAINHASAGRFKSPTHVTGQINSVSLRMMKNIGLGAASASSTEIPVKVQWSGFNPYDDDTTVTFLSEVVVVAQDRKLLLADCSEIVSEMSKIVKTGSATTHEHATLVFLVQVANLENLQKLMDELGQVRSVMSVERRFGSSLL